MIALADPVRAEAALSETLNTHWNDALAADYGLLQTENTKAQLQTAKAWLKKHPDSAELQLTLGRLSLRNRLWGKAHVHFLDSLKLRETPEAHAELGRLLKHMGEQEAYQSHVQKGFEVVAAGLPKLPMPEKSHSDIA
jgi:HemY protein